MPKVLITTRGCFGLSQEAVKDYAARKGKVILLLRDDPADYTCDGFSWSEHDIPRDDPDLHAVVADLGESAYGPHCLGLKLVDVPDDVKWHIVDSNTYSGDRVVENHRYWNATGEHTAD